jgi:hypothetical protein
LTRRLSKSSMPMPLGEKTPRPMRRCPLSEGYGYHMMSTGLIRRLAVESFHLSRHMREVKGWSMISQE